ncbi:DUF4030 domain-containing protein [Rossellomorea marisflavi]|uniref:DUF4030 domain-containing protein n=1 Tax=Rossellomorea marisflavi TaxID=189381 RepID=UPI003457A9C9
MKRSSSETQLDQQLSELESNMKWRGERDLKNRILSTIDTKQPLRKGWLRMTAYALTACLFLFGIFIGSAFVSPTMAKVASKIPYLSTIFHSETLHERLWEEFKKNDINVIGISGTRDIIVSIEGSEEDLRKVSGKIKSISRKVFSEKGYDATTVEVVLQVDKIPQPSEMEEKLDLAWEEAKEKLTAVDVTILSGGISLEPDSDHVSVEVSIPASESRKEEIKTIIQQTFEFHGTKDLDVKVQSVDVEKEKARSTAWNELFQTMIEGLMTKKEYQVTGFAYSFSPPPLQIIIKTSIKESDPDRIEKVGRIETDIQQFLQSDEVQKKINKEEYQLVIRSKEGNKIN